MLGVTPKYRGNPHQHQPGSDDEGGIGNGLVVDIMTVSFPILFIEQIDFGNLEGITAGTAFQGEVFDMTCDTEYVIAFPSFED